MFRSLDAYALGLDVEPSREVRRQFVEYFRAGRWWFTLDVREWGVLTHLALRGDQVEAWSAGRPSPIEIRRRGARETEYSVLGRENLEDARRLIELAAADELQASHREPGSGPSLAPPAPAAPIVTTPPPAAPAEPPPAAAPSPDETASELEADPLGEHLAGRPPSSVALLRTLDAHAIGLAGEATRDVRSRFVEYFRSGRWWFTLEARDAGVVMRVSLDLATHRAWLQRDPARTALEVRRSSVGETEYFVRGDENLDDARQLIELAAGAELDAVTRAPERPADASPPPAKQRRRTKAREEKPPAKPRLKRSKAAKAPEAKPPATPEPEAPAVSPPPPAPDTLGLAADVQLPAVARESAAEALRAYLADKPAESIELFARLDRHAHGLGGDSAREVRRQFVEYFRDGKWWFTLDVRDWGVLSYLSLDLVAEQARVAASLTASPTDMRRRGVGETEYSIRGPENLDDAYLLIELASGGDLDAVLREREAKRTPSQPASPRPAGGRRSSRRSEPPATTTRAPADARDLEVAAATDALSEYLAAKTPSSIALFRRLDQLASGFGRDSSREVRRQFVEYFRAGRWWVTLDVRESGVLLVISLQAAVLESWTAQDPARGAIGVRRRGLGEVELLVDEADKMAHADALLRLAYEALQPPRGER